MNCLDSHDKKFFGWLFGIPTALIVAIVCALFMGHDPTAATASAKMSADAWAKGHGFEGPVDCNRAEYRGAEVACFVRTGPGVRQRVVLYCDAERCEESSKTESTP